MQNDEAVIALLSEARDTRKEVLTLKTIQSKHCVIRRQPKNATFWPRYTGWVSSDCLVGSDILAERPDPPAKPHLPRQATIWGHAHE